jgi:hypothetical protein
MIFVERHSQGAPKRSKDGTPLERQREEVYDPAVSLREALRREPIDGRTRLILRRLTVSRYHAPGQTVSPYQPWDYGTVDARRGASGESPWVKRFHPKIKKLRRKAKLS